MTGVRAVVFDIGNVLVEWQPERFFDSVIGPEARSAMFAEVDLHAMNDRIDRGGDFGTVVDECARAHPRWKDAILMWHDRWLDIAHPAIPGSVALLHRLRARGVPVFALTNFGIETFALAVPRYPFLQLFDRAYVSGHLGTAKPDPAIYEYLERDSGVPAENLFFTDDRAENIAAAAARGWRVHQFTDPAKLTRELVDAGVLIETEAEL